MADYKKAANTAWNIGSILTGGPLGAVTGGMGLLAGLMGFGEENPIAELPPYNEMKAWFDRAPEQRSGGLWQDTKAVDEKNAQLQGEKKNWLASFWGKPAGTEGLEFPDEETYNRARKLTLERRPVNPAEYLEGPASASAKPVAAAKAIENPEKAPEAPTKPAGISLNRGYNPTILTGSAETLGTARTKKKKLLGE